MLAARASHAQTNALLDFLEKHPVMQLGPGKAKEHRSQCKKLWQEVAGVCNSLEGARKSTQGWIKFWADKKCNVKRLAVIRGSDQAFSPIDRRILSMTGVKRRQPRYRSIKRETDESVGEDFEDGIASDTGSTEAESKPIEFVDQMMENDDERHNALMEKLFQVMNTQATALSRLAEASQSQAVSLERLAESAQQQAAAAARLALAAERVASALPLDMLDHHGLVPR